MTTAHRTEVVQVPLDDIDVSGRVRSDLGDLSDLVESIEQIGVLNPITVVPDGAGFRLVAGQRRIEAVRVLGWETVPAVVSHTLSGAVELLVAERDENTCRKAMSPVELYALGKRLEALERPAAAQRKLATLKQSPLSSTEDNGHLGLQGRTNAVVADGLGISRPQWERLKRVGDAATQGDPVAADLMSDLEAGTVSVGGAGRKYAATVTRRTIDVTGRVLIPVVHTPTYKGRDATEGARRVINTLIGIGHTLTDLDPTQLTPNEGEAAQWESDLAAATSAINRFRKRMKEHTSE